MGISLQTKFPFDRMDNGAETLQAKKLNDKLEKITLEIAQAQEDLNSKRIALAR
jgi:hypothetical protein